MSEIWRRDRVIDDLICTLETAWVPPEEIEDDRHAWVPYPVPDFVEKMLLIMDMTTKRRWLGVGCGIGTKLWLARLVGFTVTGIEVRKRYIDVARQMVPDATLIHADAREWNGYGDFDVVYMYRPLVKNDPEKHLEHRVLMQVRDDAILFWPNGTLPYEYGWRQEQRDGIWVHG